MNEIIIAKLKEIEAAENVRILYAVESGSRAWGFASPDSDYDVRFLYVRPAEEYLRLDEHRDVIEHELNEVWDINGWDIRKALILAYKSNPTLFEWINSPVVYWATEIFERNKNRLLACFQKKHVLYHYASMAKKDFLNHFKDDTAKLKNYFYVIRPILAFRWIAEKNSLPPVAFSELVNSQLEKDLLPEIEKLLVRKIATEEGDQQARIPMWDRWIQENLAEIDTFLSGTEEDLRHSIDDLNQLFLEFVYEGR
ncbi:MAG: nucleotidyltransferase domain-containing protein [Clostridiales Family XIII bacterium]|jgi:predicted nucleotidyltransferase|nr:nucleotidyltransferase domain-containing protein [Clostridiales Family XIII bacterium]